MRWIGVLLLLAGLAGMALFAAWAFQQGESFGGGWADLRPIMPYVVGGLVVVGGLTAGLMWLAFYSSRKGFDEPFDLDEPQDR